jgi:hypothetical protein
MAGNLRLGVIVVAGALALVVMAGLAWRSERPEKETPGPRTLTEVAQVAGRLGLYFRSNLLDGRFDGDITWRLVVSDRPINHERANSLLFQTDDPCWKGTVAVTLDPNHGYDHYFLTQSVPQGWIARWGTCFLFGDPALVRQLTLPERSE